MLLHIGSLFVIGNEVKTCLALGLGLKIGIKKSQQIKTVSKITFETQIVFQRSKNAGNNHLAAMGHHTSVNYTPSFIQLIVVMKAKNLGTFEKNCLW